MPAAVILNDTVMEFLLGDRFSNGVDAPFTREPLDRVFRSRIDWLNEICAAKKIVHVGCVDHDIDQVKRKRTRGKWLHAHLMESAERVLGVDIDAVGIDLLRRELGVGDLLAADLLHDACEPILAGQWDIMLLAEVIEHIGDPVAFLSRIRERFASVTGEFVITVPNAFARENFAAARAGSEAINSDHRFWFTPYTIAKVCVDAGLVPEQILLCRNGVVKRRSVIKNHYLGRHPYLRNNIIVRASARP